MKKLLITMTLFASLGATAQGQDIDGKIRQGTGVAKASAEQATMDLIYTCVHTAKTGSMIFEGIEELKFTLLGNGSTFAYAKCVYNTASK